MENEYEPQEDAYDLLATLHVLRQEGLTAVFSNRNPDIR